MYQRQKYALCTCKLQVVIAAISTQNIAQYVFSCSAMNIFHVESAGIYA